MKFSVIFMTAATLLTSVNGHGEMLGARNITDLYRQGCGALKNAGEQELRYAPIENLSERKQKDFPEAPTFDIKNGCRGTVYERGNKVTTFQPGQDFDVPYFIQAPHPGYLKLNIVKPVEDSAGKIMYEVYLNILTVEPFAQTGGDGSVNATMPTNVAGCGVEGLCALQFFWHSAIANQTYPSCRDIIVASSGTSSASPPATPASPPTTPATPASPPTTPATPASPPTTPATPASPQSSPASPPSTPASPPATPASPPATPSTPPSPASPPATAGTEKPPATVKADPNVGSDADPSDKKCNRRKD